MPPDFTKAIPTEYAGIQMRSRMETQCALLFDRLGWKWKYEPKSYMLRNGIAYTPDFFLPNTNTMVECRGYESDKGDAQITGFAAELEQHGIDEYLVIGPATCTVYLPETEARPAVITYCAACDRFIFAFSDGFLTTCCACCESTDNYFNLAVSEGKVLLADLPSESWAPVIFSYRFQIVCFVTSCVKRMYLALGRRDLARKLSRVDFSWDGTDPDSFSMDLTACSLDTEDTAFVVQTVNHLLAKHLAARCKRIAEDSGDEQ